MKKNANIHRICAKREFGSTILDSYGLARFDNDDDDGDADDDGTDDDDDADDDGADEDDNHDCPPSFGLVSDPAGSLLCSGEKRKDQIAEALDPLNSSASTPPGTICIKIL